MTTKCSYDENRDWMNLFHGATSSRRLKLLAMIPTPASRGWFPVLERALSLAVHDDHTTVAGRIESRIRRMDLPCETGQDPKKPHTCPNCGHKGTILDFGTRNPKRHPKQDGDGAFIVRNPRWIVTLEQPAWTQARDRKTGDLVDVRPFVRIVVRQAQCLGCRSSGTEPGTNARRVWWAGHYTKHGVEV